MTNENFRRELNQVIDDMAGTPSAALPDRVRSSLADVPEQRGPFWIAGIAAAALAAIVVGVLFVVNPLNRPPSTAIPGTGSSPTPSANASPTPDSNLPAFQCTSSSIHLDYAQPPAVAVIDALRTGTHLTYDRLTIQWKSGGPTSIDLRTQSGTTFINSPKGDQVTLAGKNGILLVIHNADLHTVYSGTGGIKTGSATLVEVRQVEDFEGVVQLALGVSGATCYRAFLLTNPDRLVIDIQA